MKYKFETLVEKLHFDIISEIAKACFKGEIEGMEERIPLIISPGPKATYRCCIHSERAIAKQRVEILINKDNKTKNIINVITSACDQCPMGGYTVTNSCRGCLGHACTLACPKNAITIDENHHAHIDKTKCINCGACAKACPFGAIYNFRRPCQKACHTGAITMDENLAAKINYDKCISCGACMQKCPFGAIIDKSQVVEIINELKQRLEARKQGKKEKPFYCVVAPSIAAQVFPITVEQAAEGLIQLGFTNVVEAALGADIVAWGEAQELVEKKKLTSSCCPAFVEYIIKVHPKLKQFVSHNLSPMAEIAKKIKEAHPDATVCFVGPCTAKKKEALQPYDKSYVDYVMTFAEARALFNAREIELDQLKGVKLEDATAYGRGFAKCGGLASAVKEVLKEIGKEDFKLCPVSCDGLESCIKALKAWEAGDQTYNFIEGMVCEGGCVGGPASLTHKNIYSKFMVDKHGQKSTKKTIKAATEKFRNKKK